MDLLTMDLNTAQTICHTFIGAFLGCVAGYYFNKWRLVTANEKLYFLKKKL